MTEAGHINGSMWNVLSTLFISQEPAFPTISRGAILETVIRKIYVKDHTAVKVVGSWIAEIYGKFNLVEKFSSPFNMVSTHHAVIFSKGLNTLSYRDIETVCYRI